MISTGSLKCLGLCFTVLILAATGLATETDTEYTPVYHPELTAKRLQGKISIDGDLNDSGWRGAAKADNFAEHQPGDQTKPPVNTEAFITYDSDNLYVAFVCYDDPSTIRASFCERDNIWVDDNIVLAVDTYGDAAWAYELSVNPYGIQGDLLWSRNGGEDSGYDLVWESAGKVTDSGYQIEMAVPFSSMRFPNQQVQTWRVDFWRNHPRDVRGQYSWAAYDRDENCWPCQWGTVHGIEDVQPGRGVEIMPTVVGYQSGSLSDSDDPFSTFDNSDPDGELSLNGKYSVTSDIVVEASYNPDFSQVEADADQIDVNTNFALSFAERRPFFQEGSDLFSTIFAAVYTRSINDPDFTAKVTARKERTSFAYLTAHDENSPIIMPFEEGSAIFLGGKSTSNIMRARQTFGENSHAGILVTDRRFEGGGSGSVLSFDGAVHLSQKYKFEWQTMATHTAEPDDSTITFDEDDPDFHYSTFDDGKYTAGFNGESFWGNAYYFGVNRETRNSFVDLSYLERSPTYRTANGFQAKNDQRSARLYSQYVFRFDDGLFQWVIPTVQLGNAWNFAGELKERFVDLGFETKLRTAQTNMHSRYYRGLERWGGIDFEDIWLLHTCFNTQPGLKLAFGGSINYSHVVAQSEDPPIMEKEVAASAWVDLRPIDRLYIETSYTYVKGNALETDEELYEGYIMRSRWSLQLTKALSLRLVGQYNDFSESFDLDPLLTYRISPFSVFYVGSTYDYCTYNGLGVDGRDTKTCLTSRQFFMKLQYLFQI
ncbi:MAG: DUF5916 domain-containing protein [Candidatus Zixiibacteriota bacterium]